MLKRFRSLKSQEELLLMYILNVFIIIVDGYSKETNTVFPDRVMMKRDSHVLIPGDGNTKKPLQPTPIWQNKAGYTATLVKSNRPTDRPID